MASLLKCKAGVFRKSESSTKARITDTVVESVILIDGEIVLRKPAERLFSGRPRTIDPIHVVEKLWIAAHQHYKKKRPGAEEFWERVQLLQHTWKEFWEYGIRKGEALSNPHVHSGK